MRSTILIILGFLLLACEQENFDAHHLEGNWQLHIAMFDNSTAIGSLSGNIEFKNDYSAVFVEHQTLEASSYNWSIDAETLQLTNSQTGFIVSYKINEQTKHHIGLSYGAEVKMNLFR